MIIKDDKGEIITFYSYKGGTGRTMALANVACLLVNMPSTKVLIIDWDLHAPGLHLYFSNYCKKTFGENTNAFENFPGVVDLFNKLNQELTNDMTEEDLRNYLRNFKFEDFIIQTDIPNLDLIKAGSFIDTYQQKMNLFKWESLYSKVPTLFPRLAHEWARRYNYVLIDSRTGYSDVSNICTFLMPEKLVITFTPNHQSFSGIKKLITSATGYRRESSDVRPLELFPLLSRTDPNRGDLRDLWRFGDSAQGIEGYQPFFEDVFKKVYLQSISDQDESLHHALEDYFNEVLIQHSSFYAYGERIASLIENDDNVHSMSTSYKIFTHRLVKNSLWSRQAPETANVISLDITEHFSVATDEPMIGKETQAEKSIVQMTTEKNQYVCYASYGEEQQKQIQPFIDGLNAAIYNLEPDRMKLNKPPVYTNSTRFDNFVTSEVENSIAEALCQSACMVLFYTPDYFSAVNQICMREYSAMRLLEQQRDDSLIIPVVLKGYNSLPPEIEELPCFNFETLLVLGESADKHPDFQNSLERLAKYVILRYQNVIESQVSCSGFELPKFDSRMEKTMKDLSPSQEKTSPSYSVFTSKVLASRVRGSKQSDADRQ